MGGRSKSSQGCASQESSGRSCENKKDQVAQATIRQALLQGYFHWLQAWIEEPTREHILSFKLRAALPNRMPGSTWERNAPSSTRARGTKLPLVTRLRNPRSVRSGVRSLVLMEAPELFEQSSPLTFLLWLWDTVFVS